MYRHAQLEQMPILPVEYGTLLHVTCLFAAPPLRTEGNQNTKRESMRRALPGELEKEQHTHGAKHKEEGQVEMKSEHEEEEHEEGPAWRA
jgi:hypothetical protein